MSQLTRLQRDRMQHKAFQAVWRLNHDLSVEERFVTAICATSDDVFDKLNCPELLEKYKEMNKLK